MDTYVREVNELYDDLLEMFNEDERTDLEDTMNAVDVDHHHRASSYLL